MPESQQLRAARERLARAETCFGSTDGLTQLEEGLALLDELIEEADAEREALRKLGDIAD